MGRIIYTLILLGLSMLLLSGSQQGTNKKQVEKKTNMEKTVLLEKTNKEFK